MSVVISPPTHVAPALAQEHLRDARLFATRDDMLAAMPVTPGGIIAEIGVAHGDFSEKILNVLRPRTLVAFDVFEMHTYKESWGVPTEVLLKGMTHPEYYRSRFAGRSESVVVEQGRSIDMVARYPDNHFDMIYVDAQHDYDGVKADTKLAAAKVKRDGVLIFNDYTLFDPFGGGHYGVVQAVNELVVATDWKVIGFALNYSMFCDIAVKR